MQKTQTSILPKPMPSSIPAIPAIARNANPLQIIKIKAVIAHLPNKAAIKFACCYGTIIHELATGCLIQVNETCKGAVRGLAGAGDQAHA